MRIKNNIRYSQCPLCLSSRIRAVGTIDYVSSSISTQVIELENKPELWKCNLCYSCFTQNVIPEEVATRLYENGRSGERWSGNSFRESKGEEIIRTVEMIFEKGRKVLDVGCNTGELLDFAKTRGCKTFGVELSETSRKVSIKKGHLTFPSLDKATGPYDVITAFDLVEHLYDFPMFLEHCFGRLAKNGLLVILTGDISCLSARMTGSHWWYVKYPEHILFLSRKYIQSLANFKIVDVVYTYASIGYKHSCMRIGKGFTMNWAKGSYEGLPSLGPDHMLAVLKK